MPTLRAADLSLYALAMPAHRRVGRLHLPTLIDLGPAQRHINRAGKAASDRQQFDVRQARGLGIEGQQRRAPGGTALAGMETLGEVGTA